MNQPSQVELQVSFTYVGLSMLIGIIVMGQTLTFSEEAGSGSVEIGSTVAASGLVCCVLSPLSVCSMCTNKRWHEKSHSYNSNITVHICQIMQIVNATFVDSHRARHGIDDKELKSQTCAEQTQPLRE